MIELAHHVVLVGATASGKSNVGVDLASLCNPKAEIISLDSMQIYKGMEIGTGVVTPEERRGIVHHQIGIESPTQEHSVKQFKSEVYELLNQNEHKKYIFVGGTGLYTHAIVDNFEFAPTSSEARSAIIEKYVLDEKNPDIEKVGQAYELLTELDADAAAKIDPLNVRRIVRALEAIEIGSSKFSEIGDGVQAFGDPKIDVQLIGLRFSRDVLRDRIANRVEVMFDLGWIEEVKKLIPIWSSMTAPARNAIGYTLIFDWIQGGEIEAELSELKEKIVNKTAQFSRRQRKWFERDPRISWVDCDDLDQDQVIETLKTLIKNE